MGIKKQTKTMRINRRDFFMLTIMTPLFAAVVATVLVLGIVMPALKNDRLEVPTLGDTKDSTTKSVTYHIEEYDEDATKKEETKKEEQKTEEKPAETQKTEAPVAAKLPTLIKTQPSSQKTAQTQQKQDTNTNAQNDAKKKAEEDAKKKAEAEAKAQADKEAAAKAACEARTDGPRTYIRVHFLTSIDRFYASIFSDKEDPIVDYYKASAKEGKSTKMFYQNGACLPSVEDFDIIEDSYLEEADLEAYGITARTDYEAWI